MLHPKLILSISYTQQRCTTIGVYQLQLDGWLVVCLRGGWVERVVVIFQFHCWFDC